MGHTLANHSYVDLSLVGSDSSGSDSVHCHTDLSTCCNSASGPYRGDWYSPSGSRVQFSGIGDDDIYERRHYQRVNLYRRNSASEPSGIYFCDIATVAVHDYNSARERVYVGLYTTGGEFIKF